MNVRTMTLIAVFGLVMTVAPPVSAQNTIHVPGDYASIQEGLNAANTGDTVLVGPGTYTGPNNTDNTFLGRAITLRSTDGPDVTIIECGHSGRGFYFTDGEGRDTVVDGFTIRNGEPPTGEFDGGGFYINGASPTIRNCVITYCLAARWGGGVYVNAGLPFIDSCTFSYNGSGSRGGGLFGSAVIWNSDFISNEANDITTSSADGGAAYITGDSEVRGCRFVGNTACRGGALWISNGSVRNALFYGNMANTPCSTENFGGAVFVDQPDRWIDFSTFVENDALDGGASIYTSYGTTNIWHSILWDSPTNGLASEISGEFSITYSDVAYDAGVFPGTGNLNADPLFVTGPGASPVNSVYLSQTAAGQAADSPAINAGQYTSLFFRDFGFGDGVRMDTATTRTDMAPDAGMVDLGYHQYFGLLFADGFEGGTTDGWDDVVP